MDAHVEVGSGTVVGDEILPIITINNNALIQMMAVMTQLIQDSISQSLNPMEVITLLQWANT